MPPPKRNPALRKREPHGFVSRHLSLTTSIRTASQAGIWSTPVLSSVSVAPNSLSPPPWAASKLQLERLKSFDRPEKARRRRAGIFVLFQTVATKLWRAILRENQVRLMLAGYSPEQYGKCHAAKYPYGAIQFAFLCIVRLCARHGILKAFVK